MKRCGMAAGLRAASLLLALFLLTACGVVPSGEGGNGIDALGGGLGGGAPDFANPDFERTPPPVAMPSAAGANVVQNSDGVTSAMIDLSNVNDGYVAASSTASVQVILRMECAGYVYDYVLATDGTVEYFPMAVGNGYYVFTVFVQNTGTEFYYFLTAEADVQMPDEKLPFTVPNKIVNYTPDSQAVAFSYELAQHASTDLEVIQQVYHWIETNVTYDQNKVEYVQENTTYLPDVDQVLREKKGICYDYAALAAAMLRANGIPCQLIMGNANTPDGQVLHAWNLVWTEQEGWIAVEIAATPNSWERIDLTFAASQSINIEEFIGDGSNYMDMYVH